MNTASICAAIAATTITGVTVYDLDEIPDQIIIRGNELYLCPSPFGLISNLTIERQTLGSNANYTRNYNYELNYLLYVAPFGEGRGLVDIEARLIDAAVLVLETLGHTNYMDAGAIRFIPYLKQTGMIQDAAEGQFHGALLAIQILEFGEVTV